MSLEELPTPDLVTQAEERLLDGLAYPNGRPCDSRREKEEQAYAIPRILQAYATVRRDRPENLDVLNRIYFLARYLTTPSSFLYSQVGVPSEMREELNRIAAEGRAAGTDPSDTVDDRVRDARLFSCGITCALQVKHPAGGCSASVCSNCGEPVAYCDQECPACKYCFVGPFGGLKLDEWRRLTPDQRRAAFDEVVSQPNYGKLTVIG